MSNSRFPNLHLRPPSILNLNGLQRLLRLLPRHTKQPTINLAHPNLRDPFRLCRQLKQHLHSRNRIPQYRLRLSLRFAELGTREKTPNPLFPAHIDGRYQQRCASADWIGFRIVLFDAEVPVDDVGFGVAVAECAGYASAPGALGVAGVDEEAVCGGAVEEVALVDGEGKSCCCCCCCCVGVWCGW